MGFWGYEPFQNDYALDDLGGYSDAETLLKSLYAALDAERYNGYEHVAAVICDSFGISNKLGRIPSADEMEIALQDSAINDETIKLLCETTLLKMSACTIPVNDRMHLLSEAMNGINNKSCVYNDCINLIKAYKNNKLTAGSLDSELVSKFARLSHAIRTAGYSDEYAEYLKDDSLFVLGQTTNGTNQYILATGQNNRTKFCVSKAAYSRLLKSNKVANAKNSMVNVIVLSKLKKNGKVHYIVTDTNGLKMIVDGDQLKDAIRNGKIQLINYTLTSDNRLVKKRRDQ